MSTLSSFVGRSVPRVETLEGGRSPSSLDVVLRRAGRIDRPVDLALTLKRFGLRLSEAHDALDRIAADEAVPLTLKGTERTTVVAELAELGVAAD